MIDLDRVADLAEKAHKAEIVVGSRHRPLECDVCQTVAVIRMKLEEAEQAGSNIVLYIP